MIKSFKCESTRLLFYREKIGKFPNDIQKTALRKLRMIDAATSLTDLKVPPGNRLEKLKGNRAGQHSVRINDKWRVCFRWEKGTVYDVEIVDYH
jgi:proteic killer suppression protein